MNIFWSIVFCISNDFIINRFISIGILLKGLISMIYSSEFSLFEKNFKFFVDFISNSNALEGNRTKSNIHFSSYLWKYVVKECEYAYCITLMFFNIFRCGILLFVNSNQVKMYKVLFLEKFR